MPDGTPAAATPATPATPQTPEAAEAKRAATPVVSSWLDSLPDGLKTDATLSKYKTAEDAHRAHVEAVKLIGKKQDGMVRVPGADATPEEIAAFRTARGVPEAPDKYQVARPAIPETIPWNEDLVKTRLFPVAHKLGLTQTEVQELVNLEGALAAEAHQARINEVVASEAELKRAWGANYAGKLALINREVANIAGGPEMVRALTSAGIESSPAVLKFLDGVVASYTEAGYIQGRMEGLPTPDQAERRMADIRADKDYWDDFQNPGRHAELVKEFNGLLGIRAQKR